MLIRNEQVVGSSPTSSSKPQSLMYQGLAVFFVPLFKLSKSVKNHVLGFIWGLLLPKIYFSLLYLLPYLYKNPSLQARNTQTKSGAPFTVYRLFLCLFLFAENVCQLIRRKLVCALYGVGVYIAGCGDVCVS